MVGKNGDERSYGFEKLLNKKISRRDFIKYSLICAGGAAAGVYGYKYLFQGENQGKIFPGDAPDELWKWSKEAYHYTAFGDGVKCRLCPNECFLENGDRGICRVRVNIDNKLYSLAYGNPSAVHVDPIEKKPLFHFLPQTLAFSVATAGCNLRCLNCQNWDLSQAKPEDLRNYDLMPEKTVAAALQGKCKSIAYTYSEPSIFYEYMHDCSKLANGQGMKNLWITNGYMNEKPLRELCKYLDAANVDLKCFKESIYNELNAGSLKPVLNTLKVLKDEKKWFEITNLIVPSWTDDLDMIKEMSEWLIRNGFEDYPLHFSRFTPMYKLQHLPSTPVSILKDAREIAMSAGIKYVYIGNVPGNNAESTYCPKCGKAVIGRKGYIITENNLNNGTCRFCGEKIAGVWEA